MGQKTPPPGEGCENIMGLSSQLRGRGPLVVTPLGVILVVMSTHERGGPLVIVHLVVILVGMSPHERGGALVVTSLDVILVVFSNFLVKWQSVVSKTKLFLFIYFFPRGSRTTKYF